MIAAVAVLAPSGTRRTAALAPAASQLIYRTWHPMTLLHPDDRAVPQFVPEPERRQELVPRLLTGALFVVGAVAFAVAATVLSSTFDWPDILREPAGVVLPAFVAGGTSLVWTRFATAWTYAILLVPILLLPAAVGRRDDAALRAATFVGAASVLLSLIGFLRWVFVVPPLADSYVSGDATTQAAVSAAWTAQHQFGGALLGEHLGQLLVLGWSVTVAVMIVRSRVLPTWVGWAGLVASGLYLLNQGDILATAVTGFPVWDLAGLIGSTAWALWVIALGVTLLRRQTAAGHRNR